MHAKLTTVSAVTLALAVAAPAAAQIGQQQGVGPETRPGMTQPGQTLPGDATPDAGTPDRPGQPPTAPGRPGTAQDPTATPGAPGTTITPGQPPMQPGAPQDPLATTPGAPDPTTPGVPVRPGDAGMAQDPLTQDPMTTDPGDDGPPLDTERQRVPGAGEPPATAEPEAAPGAPVTPGEPVRPGEPGPADDPLATDPGAGEAPLATDRPGVPGAGEPPAPTEPGVEDPLAPDPAVEDDDVLMDPDILDDPLVDDVPDLVDPVIRDEALPRDPALDNTAGAERMTLVEIEAVLRAIGAEDVDLFFGSVVRATVGDGPRVVMLIGPEDFRPGEADMAAFAAFDEVRADLEEAGFSDVRQDIDWYVMQGRLDGHAVFAMEAADMGPDAALVEAGVETADGEIDAEGLRERLGEAGIEAEEDFEPKLFRAEHDGRALFLLVGPEGMGPGAVELSEDELRERFEGAGLTDVAVVEDVPAVRGAHDGSALVAIGDVEALRDERG